MVEKYGLGLSGYGSGWMYEVDEAIKRVGDCESVVDRIVRVVPGWDKVIYKEPEFREVPDKSNWERLRRLEDRVWSLEQRLRNHVTTIDYMAHKQS